ncbi:hypothetical protein RDWZM_007819 [Blomia tropicalis]|uniref:Small ribosomal subunit protein eS31 domain-containing protein n=1 Tax=Blomia tropicalis TaxID=40697 RepID=A0A9Q0M384_BLOTA|nr:hypothetical protein RDWZM_007819 [Blomia tropicalis]
MSILTATTLHSNDICERRLVVCFALSSAASGSSFSFFACVPSKRKKKNYTTPKKNKHKKKKVKLSVLKFYKVDDHGKITRLRRECENKECGAGVFMANHFDRHYCGRCSLTLVFNKPEDK